MSIVRDLMMTYPDDIASVVVSKSQMHGEDSDQVTVHLKNGKVVTGEFTHNPRSSFGGIQFAGPKNITELMASKIASVLNNSYDRML